MKTIPQFFTSLCLLFMVLSNCLGIAVGAEWSQIGQDIDGEAADDRSGWAVSLSADGTIVAIGAYKNDGSGNSAGHVRVYENITGTWTQIGQDIDGEAAEDYFGWAVSLSADGTIVAIGAPSHYDGVNTAGYVRVYKNSSGTWTQIGQDINGEAAEDYSGWAVSLSVDGTVVAIGARGVNNAGCVRVYENNIGTWTQIGQDIDGEAANDFSGAAVSLSADGTIVAIGAPVNDGGANNAGHVRVYRNIAGTWTQIGKDIDGEAEQDKFGSAVSLSADGTIVAIGAYTSDGGSNEAGHVRVYENIAGTWTQIGQDIDGEEEYDNSGQSISLSADGTTVAIGAPANDVGGTLAGHVRVYENTTGTWTQIGQDIDGEAEDDTSGWAVSISTDGTIVAIGAPRVVNGAAGENRGHVRIFTLDGPANNKFPCSIFLPLLLSP